MRALCALLNLWLVMGGGGNLGGGGSRRRVVWMGGWKMKLVGSRDCPIVVWIASKQSTNPLPD